MSRPPKAKFLSLKVSKKALEERLKRDPDHLDKAAFAEQLDHLLHEALNVDISKKELIDLFVTAHKSAGVDVSRAYIVDAVTTAIDTINAAKATSRLDKPIGGPSFGNTQADETERKGADLAAELAATDHAPVGDLTQKKDSSWSSAGTQHQSSLEALDLSMIGGRHKHTEEGAGLMQPSRTGSQEVLPEGAVRWHSDGRPVFESLDEAAEYEFATGRDYFVDEEIQKPT